MPTETAFPVQSVYIEDQETNSRGMTLRDYFAAKAMQVLLPNEETDILSDAKFAYKVADAMMKAREL
jgi:hypothetical protein